MREGAFLRKPQWLALAAAMLVMGAWLLGGQAIEALAGRPAASSEPPQKATRTLPNDAYLEFVPGAPGNCKPPSNGGSTYVGCRFTLDLMADAGTNLVTAQQSYLTFTYSLIQNARVSDIGSSCVPTSTVSPDVSTFDAALQNEVCNGPDPCNFRGFITDPGSFAFASGALNNCEIGCGGRFRVARMGICASAPGQAVLHWQFSPPAPPTRDTGLVPDGGNQELFSDYVFNVLPQQTGTPISTPTSTPLVTPVYCPSGYEDVPPGHPDYKYIRCANCQTSMEAYACGSSPEEPCVAPNNYPYFRPANPYIGTKADIYKIVVTGARWPIDTSGGPHFLDVPPCHPYYIYVETAYNRGLLTDTTGEMFYPDSTNITRGRFAKILVLVNEWPIDITGGPHFTDVPPTDPFYVFIETVANRGVMLGYPDDTFRPHHNLTSMTRAEMAGVVARAFPNCLAVPTPAISPTCTVPPAQTGTPIRTPTRTPTPTCPALWTLQAPYPIPVLESAVTSLNGSLYSFGGLSNGAVVDNSYVYSPTLNTWTPIAPLPVPLRGASAVYNTGSSNLIYLIGGYDGQNITDDVILYNTNTNSYITGYSHFSISTYAHAIAVDHGLVYKIAGCLNLECTSTTNAVELYNMPTNTWSIGPYYPESVGHLMAVYTNNRVYAGGGIDANGVGSLKTYGYYYGNPWNDALVEDLPEARWGAAYSNILYHFTNPSAPDNNPDKWMIAGGRTGNIIQSNAIVWDPTFTTRWVEYGTMQRARWHMGGAMLGPQFYTIGGADQIDPLVGTTDNQRFLNGCRNPSATPIVTVTSTPPPCLTDYTYTTSTATIVPGTTDTGNHCDDCITDITLPFPFTLYDQAYTTVGLYSNGNLRFGSGTLLSCPPTDPVSYVVGPYAEDLRTDPNPGCIIYPGGNCGIYTSVSGSAPDRIFNIEWRTVYFFDDTQSANFEVRLYENAPGQQFDFVYGRLDGGSAPAGVAKNNSTYTCYPNGQNQGLNIIWTLPPCGTSTPTPMPTRVIDGHVTWDGREPQPDPSQILPISLTLRLKSGGPYIDYPARNTDESGHFTVDVSDLQSGEYLWRVKGPLYLANAGTLTLTGAPVTQVEMGLMRVGDADGDNTISIGDFNIVKGAFGMLCGDGGYDHRADFTGDCLVSMRDFNLLKRNFNTGGAPQIRPSGGP